MSVYCCMYTAETTCLSVLDGDGVCVLSSYCHQQILPIREGCVCKEYEVQMWPQMGRVKQVGAMMECYVRYCMYVLYLEEPSQLITCAASLVSLLPTNTGRRRGVTRSNQAPYGANGDRQKHNAQQGSEVSRLPPKKLLQSRVAYTHKVCPQRKAHLCRKTSASPSVNS
jgi:hypothetical protein